MTLSAAAPFAPVRTAPPLHRRTGVSEALREARPTHPRAEDQAAALLALADPARTAAAMFESRSRELGGLQAASSFHRPAPRLQTAAPPPARLQAPAAWAVAAAGRSGSRFDALA